MKHEERRIVKHSPDNLYNLVADVKKYPEILPWCLGARVKNTTLKSFEADLIIGFKIYKEIYSSKITLDKKWYKKLSEYCLKKEIDFMSTPTYERAVDELLDTGVKAFKIASMDLTNTSLYFILLIF